MARGSSVRMRFPAKMREGYSPVLEARTMRPARSIDAQNRHAVTVAYRLIGLRIAVECAVYLAPAEQPALLPVQHDIFDLGGGQLAFLFGKVAGLQPVGQGEAHMARGFPQHDWVTVTG